MFNILYTDKSPRKITILFNKHTCSKTNWIYCFIKCLIYILYFRVWYWIYLYCLFVLQYNSL